MAEPTLDDMNERIEALNAKLAAQEEENKKDEKMEARLSAIKSAMNHMTDDEKMAMKKGVEEGTDEDMKSAMKKAMEDMPDKEKKEGKGNEEKDGDKNEEGMSGNEDEEKETLKSKLKAVTATVKLYEKEHSGILIAKLVELKASLIPDLDKDVYTAALKGKTFSMLQAEYDSRKDELEAMTAAKKEPEKKHFGFGLTGRASRQSGMTKVSDIMDGGIA